MISKDDVEELIFYFDTYDFDRGDLSVGEVDTVIHILENYKETNYIG